MCIRRGWHVEVGAAKADCLDHALQVCGTPEIFKTDQARQFTSEVFAGIMTAHGIAISMDGCGGHAAKFVDKYRKP